MSLVRIDRRTDALLGVDPQNDFCPGGALPVAGGHEIMEPARRMFDQFHWLYLTQDWHPEGHVSFASTHRVEPYSDIVLPDGRAQRVWPDHCVQNTRGAEFHPVLQKMGVRFVQRKGMRRDTDSYSGVRENVGPDGIRRPTGLADRMRIDGVRRVFTWGLAGDVCVLSTAEDLVPEGFEVFVFWNLTRFVDPANDAKVRAALEAAGVRTIVSSDLVAA